MPQRMTAKSAGRRAAHKSKVGAPTGRLAVRATANLKSAIGPAMGFFQFLIFSSSLLLKIIILNLAYLVYLASPEFSTDLFVNQIDGFSFFYCAVVVNAVAYLFHRGFTKPVPQLARRNAIDPSINLTVIFLVLAGLTLSYFALGQKALSLSISTALLGIAANSRVVSLIALLLFAEGVPEALSQDEYIPLIFGALINFFVFMPWLLTKGRVFFYILLIVGGVLMSGLISYYIFFRYNLFKLVERIFEQAAPLSWEGSPLLWFMPHSIIGGMPDERVLMAMNGEWDAQFKMTYLVGNAPIFGSLFLLCFAYLLGRFSATTLIDCQTEGSSVLKNFLKLKLIVILVEVLGEKVFDLEKILVYAALIAVFSYFDAPQTKRRQPQPPEASSASGNPSSHRPSDSDVSEAAIAIGAR